MIESYNTEEFGRIARNIRNTLELTQQQVRKNVGISENTLMKLENGMVIPKFETLELLSLAYKIDMTAIFQRNRLDSSLSAVLSLADEAIMENRPEELQRCNELFEEYIKTGKHKELINAADIEIIRSFLQFATLYYREDLKDLQRREIIDEIHAVLLKSNPELKWHQMEQYSFNLWELRLVNLLALLQGDLGNHETAIHLLEAILSAYADLRDVIVTERRVLLNSEFNLSYQYHMIDRYEDALNVAERGIHAARSFEDIHLLHGLYYRKGIAQFMLKIPDYEKTLLQAVVLLEIQGKQSLADLYRRITLNTYGIMIP